MEFLSGSKEEFFEFMNSLSKKDRIAIISHTDLDGLTSAVLMEEMLSETNIKPRFINFINYGSDMFNIVYKKLKSKKIGKAFLLDINESSDYEGFRKIQENFGTFLVDHHPSKAYDKGVIKTKTKDCSALTLYRIGEGQYHLERWKGLVCATMITEFSYTDDPNLAFIQKLYPRVTRESILNSIPGKVSQLISSGLIYLHGREKRIYDLVKKGKINELKRYDKIIRSEVEKVSDEFKEKAEYSSDKELYFFYSPLKKFDISSFIITTLSVQQKDKTFVFVSDLKDKKGFVKVSARNQSGNVDLNLLMKKGISDLKNASAGGHVKASGASFMKRDLDKFKENLLEL